MQTCAEYALWVHFEIAVTSYTFIQAMLTPNSVPDSLAQMLRIVKETHANMRDAGM